MAKKRNYNQELRKIQTDLCNEIQKELKRIGKDFTAKKDKEDIEFFGYDSCVEQDVTKLTKDGDVITGTGKNESEPFSIHSALAEDIISLLDAVSIVEDLRKI